MNDLLTSPSLSIARAAFQFILHHALQAEAGQPCCGLLAAKREQTSYIEYISLADNAQVAQPVLQGWDADGLACVGFFCLSSAEDDALPLMAAMPEAFIKLSVCLDEKGRLDVLAYLCRKGSDAPTLLSVSMIEDGQPLADV